MRIAVLGGAGFLGRHICELELKDGNEVICIDNFFTGQRANISSFLDNQKFELVRHDIVEPIHLEVDRIYHLACPAAPLHYARNPARTIETGVLGTLNALRLARETRARLLFTSTSEVYGNPTQHPQREDYWGHVNPIGSRSCYDESKRAGEALCAAYASQWGVDVRIARLFNTYGPYMASGDGRVIPAFLEAIKRREPLPIFGSGSQTRSFCYVSDTVDALLRLMRADKSALPALPVVNIGNPEEVAIHEVARVMSEIAGIEHISRITEGPVGDDPERRCPDITRAKAWLNWEPKVPLREGLRLVLA